MSALGHVQENRCPLYPRKRTSVEPIEMSAMCHVWTAPGWQEESSRSRLGRCSHVFGLLNAVHMTAGHNAFRGSGPGQNPAFENAMAQVGCPDRRIDRLCFTCCSSSQPSHHAGCRRDPGHAGQLVGKGDRGDFGVSPCQQCCEPGPMLCAMDLGIADHGERAGHEQAPQIAVTLFADTAELIPTSTRVLLGY